MKVSELADEVSERATEKNALYRTIGIKVVQPPFDVHTRSRSLSGPIDDPGLVERIAVELLAEFESDVVRKLGVRLSNLSFGDREQATITEWATPGDGAEDDGEKRWRWPTGGQAELSRFE